MDQRYASLLAVLALLATTLMFRTRRDLQSPSNSLKTVHAFISLLLYHLVSSSRRKRNTRDISYTPINSAALGVNKQALANQVNNSLQSIVETINQQASIIGDTGSTAFVNFDGNPTTKTYNDVLDGKTLASTVTLHELELDYVVPLVGQKSDTVTVPVNGINTTSSFSDSLPNKTMTQAVTEHALWLDSLAPTVGNKGQTASYAFDSTTTVKSYEQALPNLSLT
jgi:hypothetical protein